MNATHSSPALALDPVLPQRDLLLNEPLMAEYLSRLLARFGDFRLHDCERLRTKYRVGTSLRVLYALNGGGQSYRIAARAFPRTRHIANQFADAPEIHAPELNTIFWVFPRDRKIKNLSLLENVPHELRDIDGQEWIESRIVGHAPEKSLTAQCLDRNGKILAYAKVYAGDEGHQIFNSYNAINDAVKTDLQIPRALSYSETHRLLLLELVPGVSLSATDSSFFQLGRALKALHGIKPPSSLARFTRLTPESLTRAATNIAQARPDVATMVQRVTNQLLACYPNDSEQVLLHGDVHPKNILLHEGRLFLLDLDQAATGSPACDLGSVIASLYCNASIGSLTWPDSRSLTHALLAGYGPMPSFTSLRWHVAAALLVERALRSVTRIRFENLQKLPEILTVADAVLNGGIGEN